MIQSMHTRAPPINILKSHFNLFQSRHVHWVIIIVKLQLKCVSIRYILTLIHSYTSYECIRFLNFFWNWIKHVNLIDLPYFGFAYTDRWQFECVKIGIDRRKSEQQISKCLFWCVIVVINTEFFYVCHH